jgi:uncharacterized protein (TIGR02722 family)
MKKIIILLVSALALSSCNTITENVNTSNDKRIAVKGLSYQDFQEAADKSIDSLLRSGELSNPNGKKYILAISKITNDTMQDIDVSQLIKKIRVALFRSGKVYINNAMGSKGDRLVQQLNRLKNIKSGNTNANKFNRADLSLSGKIMQKNVAISKNREQIEYYFQLTMTSTKTGFSVWEDEVVLGKRTDGDSVSW